MYWLDKLKEFKTEQKATYKSISQDTGIPLSTIEKLFSGRTKKPKLLMLDRIAVSLNHSLIELVETPVSEFKASEKERLFIERMRKLDSAGYDRMLTTLKAEEERMIYEKRNATAQLYHKIYYDFPVSAGTGEFLDDTTVAIAELTDKPPLGTDYILKIAGDSMEPEFHDGDYVYVKRTESLLYGDIGIFVSQGNVYIKEYTQKGLLSLNPAYELIPGTEDIKCLGRVLGKVLGNLTVC